LLGVTGVVNDVSMQFLVDSGATNNFISVSELERLGEIVHV
jgi:predicted aspartyl protease